MEPLSTLRVFISSPSVDLEEERKVVLESLQSIDECRPVSMPFGSRPQGPIDASLAQLRTCQAFVAFFGGAFGSGVTEQEYEEARRLKLPCFIYFRRPDLLPSGWEVQEPRLAALKRKIDGLHDTFATPNDLGRKVAIAISNWIRQPGSVPPELAADLERLAGEFSRELAREQAEPLGLEFDSGLSPLSTEEELLATPIRERAQGSQAKTLGDLLGNKTMNRFVLIGEPGSGKTSILKQIALHDVHQLQAGDTEARLPAYVRLIWYLAETHLEELVIESVQGSAPSMDVSQVRHWLTEGRVRVLLDGLNEVSIAEYQRCRAEILRLMGRYPRSAFVVTDRPTYDGALPAPAFRLQDWDLGQIRDYVERAVKRLVSPQDPELLLERINCDPRLKSIVSSPLPLGILTSFYGETGQIAVNRGELYRSFVNRLVTRERQGAHPTPSATALLQTLAFAAVQHGLTSLSETLVLEHLGKCLQDQQNGGELAGDLTVREILDRLLQQRWLLKGRAGSQLQFRYTALQEYFAARELLDRWQRNESLATFIADARFEEPVVLMANLLGSGVGPFLDQVRKIAGIQLAAKCLIGAGEDIPGRERIVRQLARELSSRAERRRRSAAAKFIFLRAPEAIPALAEALADDSGAVRWISSLAIERTLDRPAAERFFVDILASIDHSPRLKRIACQALGRSGSSAGVGALIRSLDDPDEDVRTEAARSLSKVLEPGSLRLLKTAASGGVGERIQAGALRALSLSGAESTAELARSCLNHSSPLVSREARIALGRLGDRKAVASAVRQATDAEDMESRARAIQELEEMGPNAQAAVEPLWNLLHFPDLKDRLVQAFRDIGGTTVLDLARRDLAGTDPTRRRTVVSVLGHLRDDRAIDLLARALRDEDWTIADTASTNLEEFGDRAMPVLQEALNEARATRNRTWHRAVLLSLKKIGTRMSLQLLVEAVDDLEVGEIALKYLSSSDIDSEQVRLILRERRPDAVGSFAGQLEELLERVQLQYDIRLALDLRNGADPEVWNELVEETRSDLSTVRKSACAALGETSDARAESILRRIIIEDPCHEVRTFAVTALMRLGWEADADLLAVLARLADDAAEETALRLASIRALGVFGGEDEQELLKHLTRVEEPALANAAALAVMDIEKRQLGGPPVRREAPEWMPILVAEALRSRYRGERQRAAETIPMLDLPEGRKVTDLGRVLEEDPDVRVRRSAILSLRQIGTAAAMRRLEKIADDSQPVLRELTVNILAAKLELPEAYKALTLFLGDPILGVRRGAVEGLATLPSAVLTEEHADAVWRCLFAEDPFVRGGMVEALPALLLTTYLPRLLRLAEDRHFYPRSAAVRALARAPFEEARKALSSALQDESAVIRCEAVRTLAQMGTPAAYELLGWAAHDGHPTVAEEVLAALPTAPAGSTGLLLAPLLSHRSEEIRLQALQQVEEAGCVEVGEALIEVIRDRRPSYREAQWRAIEVAGKLRVQVAAPLIAELVGHASRPLRERAAAALEQIGTSGVVPQLLTHLRNEHAFVKATVIPLLGMTGSSAAAELLASMAAKTHNSWERQEALSALGKLDTPVATHTLVQALGHRDTSTDQRAREALLEHASMLSTERLLELLSVDRPAARAISARQLGKRHLAAAPPLLIGLLQDPIPEVRSAAAEALGQIGLPEGLEALFRALGSRETGVLLPALRAVGVHKWRRAIGFLLTVLRHADTTEEEVVHAAEEALVLTSVARRLPELLDLLRHEHPRVRQSACRVLKRLSNQDISSPDEWDGPQVINSLVAILRRAGQLEAEVVYAAEDGMLRTRGSQARTELLGLLRNDNSYVQQAACRVLGILRAEEAVHLLVKLLDDKNPHTRRAAVDALHRIGSEEVVDELLPVLHNSKDWRLRNTAVRVMGEMRVEEATGTVGEVLLKDPRPELRQAAAVALGQIGTAQAMELLGLAALDRSPAVRDSALLSLATVPTDSPASAIAADGLRLLLEDRYQPRRLKAVEALASNGSRRAIEGLLQAVHDHHPEIRKLAIRALGKRRTGESLEILTDATLDPVQSVSHAAERALNEVRDALLDEALQLATRREKRYVYIWRQTREKIQILFEQMGPEWVARAVLDWLSKGIGKRRPSHLAEETCVRLLGWVGRSVSHEDLRRELEGVILRAITSKQRDLRIAALIAIGDAGLEDAVVQVLRFARSPDSYEQQAVIRALTELRVKESVPTLRSLAKPDQNLRTRFAAIRAFEDIEDRAGRPEVLEALGDSDRSLHRAAIVALGKIGTPEDVPALVEYLHDPDAHLRYAASISLRKLRAEGVTQEFVALLKDTGSGVVDTAIRACKELGITAAVEPLVDIALFSPAPTWELAADALQTLRSPMAVDYLAPLAAPGCAEAGRTLEILARIHLPEAHRVLTSALASPSDELRLAAVQALTGKHEQVRQLGLSKLLGDANPLVRRETVSLLAGCDLVQLFQPNLIELLKDDDSDVRAEAAAALGRSGEFQTVAPLITAAEIEADGTVQFAMLRALARLGTPDALARLAQWRGGGAAHERFRAVAAIQAERLREIVEETTSRSPAERLNDPNPYIQSAAIRQIGQKGLVTEAPRLLAFLRAPNPFLLQAAIDALSQLGERSSVTAIRTLASSDNPWTRARVAEALGRFADLESLSTLEVLLEDRAFYVRRAAAAAILEIESPRSLEVARRILEEGDPALAFLMAERLAQRQNTVWTAVLLHGLVHREDEVRIRILRLLAERTLEAAELSGIQRVLDSPNSPQVLREALLAVARSGARQLAPQVAGFLAHRDSFVRAEAARTLGELDAGRFAADLIGATRDSEQHVVTAATRALGRMRASDCIPALAELLGHEERAVVAAAAQALASVATPEAGEALGQVFSHPSGELREEAVRALQGAPAEVALPHLLNASRDENSFVREKAVDLLGDWSGKGGEVIEALAGALYDPNRYVRLSAVGALARLRSEPALARLGGVLTDPSPHVRARAVWALSQAPDGDVQEQLIAALRDENSYVRFAAVAVLGRCSGVSWLASVADVARHDPVIAVRFLARRTLQHVAGRGGQTYLSEIEREEREQAQALQAPQVREMAAALSAWQQRGCELENEEERLRLLSCLTQAFSSGLIPLRHSAGQLLNSLRAHPEALPIYEYAIQDPLPEVRKAGLRSLAGLGTSQARERLQSAMMSEDSADVRLTLITEAEALQDEGVAVCLIQSGLADPNRAVALRALRVLVQRRIPQAFSLIVPLLNHSDDFLREAAVNALGQMNATEAITYIRHLLADPSWYVRQDAVKVLGGIGSLDVALEACRRGFEDPHFYVQLTSAQTLRGLRTPTVIPLLLEQLRHSHAAIRGTAARAIQACMEFHWPRDLVGFSRDEIGERILGYFSAERDVQIRAELVGALAAWDLPQTARLLQGSLLDKSAVVRRKVLAVCEKAPEGIDVNGILSKLEAAGEEITIWVRRDLSALARGAAPERFLPLLLRLVSDDDEFVRANAVYGLGRAGSASGLRALITTLSDSSRMVREIAHRVLQGSFQSTSPVFKQDHLLEEIGDDEEEPVLRLRESLAALQETAPAGGEPEEGVTSLASRGMSPNWIDRWYAIVLLAEQGSPAVEDLLRIWLEETNETVRQEAERSLKRLPQSLVRNAIDSLQNRNGEKVSDDILNTLMQRF